MKLWKPAVWMLRALPAVLVDSTSQRYIVMPSTICVVYWRPLTACFWLIGASRLLCIPARIDNAIVCKRGWQILGDATEIILRLFAGCAQVHSAGGCSIQGTGEALPGDPGAALVCKHAQRTRHPGLSRAQQAAHHRYMWRTRSIRWPFQARCYS